MLKPTWRVSAHLSTQARASLALLSTSVALSDFERAKKSAVAAPFPHRLPLATLLGKTAFSPADDRTLLLDVRSPCEFARGHIPGATSLPLFTDDERAEVGTLYSTRGHDVAVARGCEIGDRSWRSLGASISSMSSSTKRIRWTKRRRTMVSF